MLFWIIAALLSALVAGLIALALLRGGEGEVTSDVAFYKGQLEGVDRDVSRGIMPEAEAERARVEIARRLLEADRAEQAAAAPGSAPRGATLVAAGLAAALLVGGAGAVYWRIGAPGYPDMPIKLRIAMADDARAARPSQAEAEEAAGPAPEVAVDPELAALVERLRQVVAQRPHDAQGLALLASNEAGLGNWIAAHEAQARLIDARGEDATADDFAMLAYYLVAAAGGSYISPEAEAAVTEALRRDPKQPYARYFAGDLFAHTGRPDLAFRFWAALLAESQPDAPWVPPIRARIEEIAALAGQNNYVLPPEGAVRGPTGEDVAAASEMSPEDRQAMIRSMVASLADRLANEGGPASDWARLIRSYGVLGEAETARPILEEARVTFAGDPEGLAEIEAAAREAGIAE